MIIRIKNKVVTCKRLNNSLFYALFYVQDVQQGYYKKKMQLRKVADLRTTKSLIVLYMCYYVPEAQFMVV